jgi:DNA-binding transcriptional regulator YiaG
VAIVRIKYSELGKGRVNLAKMRQATEEEAARWDKEDGVDQSVLGPWEFVPAVVDLVALRERLHLTQEQFAERYMLPLRTIQEWEQRRRQPSVPARVLLHAISRDPEAIHTALNGKAKSNGKRKARR